MKNLILALVLLASPCFAAVTEQDAIDARSQAAVYLTAADANQEDAFDAVESLIDVSPCEEWEEYHAAAVDDQIINVGEGADLMNDADIEFNDGTEDFENEDWQEAYDNYVSAGLKYFQAAVIFHDVKEDCEAAEAAIAAGCEC